MTARTIKPMYARRLRVRRIAIVAGIVTMIVFLIVSFALRFISFGAGLQNFSSPWHYQCTAGNCRKTLITENTTSIHSLGVCQLFCGETGALWPKPTGHLSLGNHLEELDPENIYLFGPDFRTKAGQLLYEGVERFKANIKKLVPSNARIQTFGSKGLKINVPREFSYKDADIFRLDSPEGYKLQIYQQNNGQLNADIDAASYFGARHAIETLFQLIVYDDLFRTLRIARDVYIEDKPKFPYRGVLLDTSRNYVDKDSILRIIEGMSLSKLNVFHWHITDSHSFPYMSKSLPKMSFYGAYAPDKIYTPKDIEEIVEFGLVRGVKVLPEFDAPAHVGEGWQWVGEDATVCFKSEPWSSYCVEPPCGQLNPTSPRVYEILEQIYKDMVHDFKSTDIFHMGGDEVNLNCWNSSSIITDWMVSKGWNISDTESFYRLWNHFQKQAYDKLSQANNGEDITAILWTSGLTNEENIHLIDPEKYIIQIWTTKNDSTIARLLRHNLRVIFSNYDALYLDCGFGAWVGEGNNWCSPYKGWQLIYENSPMTIVKKQGFTGRVKNLILGAEATLWTEQADSSSVDQRLWPRAAAMAERLWSDPDSSWIHAEHRFLKHRERLVQLGINADTIEPEWCMQNEGSCHL